MIEKRQEKRDKKKSEMKRINTLQKLIDKNAFCCKRRMNIVQKTNLDDMHSKTTPHCSSKSHRSSRDLCYISESRN